MGQLGIRIANVALFTVCCFQVATVFNEVSADYLRPAPTAFETTAPPAAAPRRDWSERQPILDRNLFDAQTFAVTAPPEPEPSEELEETKLPVRLLGTQVHSVRENSKAAISDKTGRKHELLHEGDSLEKHPQARVVRIERRRVVLDNKGRREELLLAEAAAPVTKARNTRDRSARRSRRSAAAASRSNRRDTGSITDRLKELQQAKTGQRDMSSLLRQDQGRLLPKWEEGQLVGMELRDVEAGGLYERIGLSEGDVITSVNGIDLDDASAASKVLPELASAEQLEIETNRGPITVGPGELDRLLAGDNE